MNNQLSIINYFVSLHCNQHLDNLIIFLHGEKEYRFYHRTMQS